MSNEQGEIMNYKHYWVLAFDRDYYRCSVCQTSITKEQLFGLMGEEERLHDCLDRIAKDVVCKEVKEPK